MNEEACLYTQRVCVSVWGGTYGLMEASDVICAHMMAHDGRQSLRLVIREGFELKLSDLGSQILFTERLNRGERSSNQWFLCPGFL